MTDKPEKIKGYLKISVAEASGKNKEDAVVWDSSFVEGFVKVEVRGGQRNIKVQTTPKRVLANSINWQEELSLEVLEESKELRIMLCREKRTGSRVGTSVIAACGIFVSDILDAVPIDKYFELFKPGVGGEGGFIRIGMNFVTDLNQPVENENGAKQPAAFNPQLSFKGYQDDAQSHKVEGLTTMASMAPVGMTPDAEAAIKRFDQEEKTVTKGRKKGKPVLKLLVVLAAAAAVAVKVHQDKQKGK
ncbi:hypothetical protein WJX72_009039 [[Myrmecia] bisecta]|uniref:C2 domain-containing protein n=1 Tax=[Myrmecia] bisecta TaxID=41462 RepID=A0AAW1P2W6_9CHLO